LLELMTTRLADDLRFDEPLPLEALVTMVRDNETKRVNIVTVPVLTRARVHRTGRFRHLGLSFSNKRARELAQAKYATFVAATCYAASSIRRIAFSPFLSTFSLWSQSL
jgi:hypothetical protein